MRLMTALLLAGSCLAAGQALAQDNGERERAATWEDSRLERLASPELRTFASEAEYRRYVRDLRRAQREIYFDRRRGRADAGTVGPAGQPVIVVAQADISYETCNPQYEQCIYDDSDEQTTIVVTGAMRVPVIAAAPLPVTSITNNQVATVDEGDIVKRIGDYLLVLQDGRIFSANFRSMQLTDRIDVYRRDEDGEPIGADWYDEMLVQGEHVLVTAYSYEDDATELSVFRLDQASGRLERRGVFLFSSEDYYDSDNYATRVVGDQLVIYTPFEPEDLIDRTNRPVIRRWSPSDDFDDREKGGTPILAAEDIYLPVFGVENPTVHMISVCALGNLDRDTLPCETTGFIAGEDAEMFVAPDNIFLATTALDYRDEDSWQLCRRQDEGAVVTMGQAPGAVFRVPLGRGEPDLLAVRGQVIDQFSMDQFDRHFRMLAASTSVSCDNRIDDDDGERLQLELVDVPVSSFSISYRPAPDRRFASVPAPANGLVENRFIGNWLLYGSRTRYGRPPDPDDDEAPLIPAAAIAVPVLNPDAPVELALGHEITRLESLGGDAIATGYRDASGLFVSYIDLAETARIANRAHLDRRFESESRSHAFNAINYPEGNGLIGLPTVLREEDADRYPWESDNSQVSFLAFDAGGALTDIGQISPTKPEGADERPPGYTCEVSCVDWYGNARPIFIERLTYALMGTELVEARADASGITVLRRLLLAQSH